MIPAQKGDKINLSLEEATARAETWRCLNQAGAPLYWCPWSIDAALNSTSANRPITIKAIAHSIAADPEALLASLHGSIESSPFWISTVRRMAAKETALFRNHFPQLLHDAQEMIWSEAIRAVATYVPVGRCPDGYRPHYFYYYLRISLKPSAAAIRARIDELKLAVVDDFEEELAFRDIRSADDDLLANECGSILDAALNTICKAPPYMRAFRLCIEQGLTIRAAAAACSRSPSSFQREAESLAVALQNHFATVLGQRPNAKPDVASTFKAIRDILICRQPKTDAGQPSRSASAQVSLVSLVS